MPKLTLEASHPLIKMLFLAYSGEGKSTSIVPLSIPDYKGNTKTGYELRWLDFDGKAEEVVRSTLARLLHAKQINQAQHDAALTNNDICQCTEATGIVSAREGRKTIKKVGVSGVAVAWDKAVKQLEKWEGTFSSDTILIVDSFTYACRAIVNNCQGLNGKLNSTLEWRDYQAPQQMAENLMILAADVNTHSIVTGHQDPLELYKATDKVDDKGQPVEELVDTLMVPISIGRAGRMKLPARMNHLLIASSEGKGPALKRYIYTEPRVGVVTKTPFFGICKTRYPIEHGLIDYFKLSRS